MARIEPPFSSGQTEQSHSSGGSPNTAETFCTYLAKQFIAKKDFEVSRVPEVERLYDVCEVVLVRSDGYTFGILGFVDREARPDATFSIGVEELEQIGKSCLQYAGKMNGTQMPVTIGVIEVGPGSPEQQLRLQAFTRSGMFAKVVPSAMAVNTASGAVWSNGGGLFSKGLYYSFVAGLLAAPREAVDLSQASVETAQPAFPLLTCTILAVLCAVFAAEIEYGIGPWSKMLEPTITTLVAFGGMARGLVADSGQWYRLLSAPFLHVDAGHLLMNGIALYLAGRSLEWVIGRAWFAAVYAISAVTGSLLSLLINPASIVAVGASGAIMGLFAAAIIVSLHFPPGAIRTGLQMNSAYVLVPSLLPLAGALKGQKVDYAAHFGGALGGALVALLILVIWSSSEPLPRFRRAAAAVAIVAAVALVYPALALLQAYPAAAFATQLIPPDKVPKTGAEMRVRAADLIKQYPHDPRPRYLKSADLLDANDLAGAEREARTALAEEKLWRQTLPHLGDGLRVMLAIAIDKDRHAEAMETARPACAAIKDGTLRKLLDERKLCGG